MLFSLCFHFPEVKDHLSTRTLQYIYVIFRHLFDKMKVPEKKQNFPKIINNSFSHCNWWCVKEIFYLEISQREDPHLVTFLSMLEQDLFILFEIEGGINKNEGEWRLHFCCCFCFVEVQYQLTLFSYVKFYLQYWRVVSPFNIVLLILQKIFGTETSRSDWRGGDISGQCGHRGLWGPTGGGS